MALSKVNPNLITNGGSRKNIIINGAMQVAQRGTATANLGAADGFFTIDRYKIDFGSSGGRLTMSQSSDVPNGFSKSLKVECTTADTSIGAAEKLRIMYQFEGQEVRSIAKGTPDAKPITVSFYVKGNAAATYACEIFDTDNSRQCTKLFNVTTGWQRIELNFPTDTTGSFTDDNNTSIQLNFHLHGGSNFTSGTLNTNSFEASVNANRLVGIDSFYDSTSRTLNITGLQLELGSVATDFEHRSYGEELALCQRYFNTVYEGLLGVSIGTTQGMMSWPFPVTMRVAPTVSATTDSVRFGDQIVTGNTLTSMTVAATSFNSKEVAAWTMSGTASVNLVNWRPILLEPNTAAHATFTFDAEL